MENLVSYYTYIGLLLITLLVSWITNKKYYSVKLNFTYNDYTELNYLIYINLLFIAFFVAFRYELGVDWYSYREFFLSGNFTAGKFEVGYKLLNSIVSSLNGDYTTVFFIISFTSWLFLFKGFPRQLLLLGAFFLFCDEWFFISTNLVRQFFAASILLFSLKSFSNEKKYKFLLLILFASTFHKAVLIFIPLLIIPWKNIYNRNVWLLLYSTSLIFRHNDYLIHQVIKITDILSTYLPIFSSYTGYFNSYLFDASNVTLSNYGILFRSLIAVYIILYSKPIINKYPSVKIYYFIFFSGALLGNIFTGIPILDRVLVYFSIFRPLLLSLTIYSVLRHGYPKIEKAISYLIILLYFVLYLYLIYINPYGMVFFQGG